MQRMINRLTKMKIRIIGWKVLHLLFLSQPIKVPKVFKLNVPSLSGFHKKNYALEKSWPLLHKIEAYIPWNDYRIISTIPYKNSYENKMLKG